MPELPEVETIKRIIEPQLRGAAVHTVLLNRPEIIASPSAEEFCERLKGQTIGGMTRRGKFLTILLENGDRVTLHLRMTGCLLVTPPEAPLQKHTHLILQLSNHQELRFSDPRRFGRFWLLQKGEEDTKSGVQKLGLEPFDEALTADYLQKQFGRKKRAVKDCLLDQSVIAGIGNIYSDEILFAAKIHPSRQALCLGYEEWQRLADTIPLILAYFIEKNDISPEEYLAGNGWDYRNTPFFKVYGHKGEPCPCCGEPLCKTTIAGRSSVFCPKCQKI